jgi:hypothetical protein
MAVKEPNSRSGLPDRECGRIVAADPVLTASFDANGRVNRIEACSGHGRA